MSRFRFGPFEVDTDTAHMRRDGRALDVQPLTVELVAILAEKAGEVVDRATLMRRLWPEVVVTEHSLSQALYRLRRALGDHANLLVTVPGRGIRFDASVTTVGPSAVGHELAALVSRVQTRPLRLVGPPGAGIAGLRASLIERLGPGAWSDDDDAEVEVVGGLGLPTGDTPTDVARSDAGAAFVRHARRWQPDFELDERSAPLVRRLCDALDGLPDWLAFAAARLRLMPLERIVARLPTELPAWTHPDRVHPPHEGSVADAVAQALGRLGRDEWEAVRDLAIFAGPVDPSTAADVLGRRWPSTLAAGVDTRSVDGRIAVWAGTREVLRPDVPPAVRERHARWALGTDEIDELAVAAAVPDPALAAEVGRAMVRACLREGGALPAACTAPEAWVLRHRRGGALPADLGDRTWAWALRARDDARHGRSARALAGCAHAADLARRAGEEQEAARIEAFAEGLRCSLAGERWSPPEPPHAVGRAAAQGDAAELARRREPLLALLATALAAPDPSSATSLGEVGALLAEACVRALLAVRASPPSPSILALASVGARDVGLTSLADALDDRDADAVEEQAARVLRWSLLAEACVTLPHAAGESEQL